MHHAAALVIARRAMGFREIITKELKKKVAVLKNNLAQKVYSQSKEGKGMTRKAGLRFKRLDGKVGLPNSLKPFQQTQFYSVWHDLKLAAFAQ